MKPDSLHHLAKVIEGMQATGRRHRLEDGFREIRPGHVLDRPANRKLAANVNITRGKTGAIFFTVARMCYLRWAGDRQNQYACSESLRDPNKMSIYSNSKYCRKLKQMSEQAKDTHAS
jgi:hypothetical protein